MVWEFPKQIIDKILEDLNVGLTLVGDEGEVLWCNSMASELLGWDQHQMAGNSILKCHAPGTREKVIDKISQNSGKEWHRILKIRGRFIENVYSPFQIPGHFCGVMIITRDVTEREKMIQVIKRAAITDELTGLYNRNFFEQVFQDFVLGNKPFAIIMMDLNGLKYINDHFGHEAGDETIMQAAHIIDQNVRKADYVFRYGGDEFAVLTEEDDPELLKYICLRIKKRNWHPTGAQPYGVSLSMGYCVSTEVDDLFQMVSCADQRMYMDKQYFYKHEGTALKR